MSSVLLTTSLQTMSMNDTDNNTITNMVFIDWQDIKWNILTEPSSAKYRNFNDEFENIEERYLNTFAFPEEATRTLNNQNQSNSHSFVELYIPSCGCKDCNSYLKISLTNLDSFTNVRELLSAINKEYSQRKITISELCKNDTENFIKNGLNRLNENLDVELCTIMNNLLIFDNITNKLICKLA